MPPSSVIAERRPAAACDECGKRLPADAPDGLCPACLIRLAWEPAAAADDPSDAGDADDTPGRVGNGRPPDRPRPTTPETIDFGRFVGLRRHDKGGLGEVFTATDTELHRTVALKRLQDRWAEDGPSRRRFLVEAEVTARLEHPGVVPVHSLFRDDADRPCYAMRFIQGQTLADAVRGYHAGPPDPVAFRRLLQSFIQVCETIAYAHSRGVIHRDLKPQNIMLGQFGETLVVDWGLAKVVGRTDEARSTQPEATLRPVGDDSGDRTELGSAVGTPAYMSPEQAAGRWDVITAASDVYGLGAVLYTLLTGRPPLEKGNWPEMQQRIQRGDFPRPRAIKPAAPKALEAVCLKAMAMKPEDRYPSARELAAEVEQWQADEPVGAYREPVTKRLGRWARRHKDWVAIGVAVVAVVVGAWIVKLERDVAVAEKARAEAEHGKRVAYQYNHNVEATSIVVDQHYKLDKEIRASLDRLAARVGHDLRLQGPDARPLRQDLVQTALDFWERAITIDSSPSGQPTWRGQHYQLQRALCLARLGDHKSAAGCVEKLAPPSKTQQPQDDFGFDVARVYALCSAAAGNDIELSEQYGGCAMKFLRKAESAGEFKKKDAAERLITDADLGSLRSREDFRELVRDVETKSK